MSQGMQSMKEVGRDDSNKRDLSKLRSLKSATELAGMSRRRATSKVDGPVLRVQDDDVSPYAET